MVKSILALGSNIGNREGYLLQAIHSLEDHPDINILNVSSIYETDPYGPVEQEQFLNMVVEIETTLVPEALLEYTQSVEVGLNRERTIHWGPRTIDIDILFYGDIQMDTASLVIPHREIEKRLFVLVPLHELDADIIVPGKQQRVKDLLNEFQEIKGVRLWKRKNGAGEYGLFES
ncbi:2-amino-4-hydroxy-6-hydroxymethyldihydropteridine diphosphokinase [Pullulanibacillus camelliae]|uniref:2-amino-4-hydroxy-6-hydroxymethyldihydropteridine diphosphokinase n=1 Tax=Pullulanibacillus camelliae TaxID=1707096 RepID=A0A8J2YMR8_9BACL|nr:2-amino-4-hydroxy-6-hydroxymethyldihydropteridine diphosphokinase [Pullulanibacillus camelliae]GGE54179.1 2-amino-4-hydroxy-6-hydroxymethyldihydropteridine diphosphokinase [Pullulanibacillus camelliae]